MRLRRVPSLIVRAVLLAWLSLPAAAATSGQALTPASVAVLGGDTREFSARFLDAQGRPAANETVQFLNDACGSFPGGGSVYATRTDANGIATAPFTARAQGVTCWLVANAGAQVRWDVLTFTMPQVHLEKALTPPDPRPGQPYVLTVTPMAGAYRLLDVEVSARVVAGTASAYLAPGASSTAQVGSAAFKVTPDSRIGDYELEVQYRSKVDRLAMRAPSAPWQDLWWGGSTENGWGMSVVQHGDMLFAVIYAYDAGGRPTWYVMPGGSWNSSRDAFSGALYAPRGAPYTRYDASNLAVGAPLGSATLNVVDGAHLALDYTIGGVSGRRIVTRQDYAPVDAPLASSKADMWWGGAAQNGWGVAILQQYRTLFLVWFTYDEAGMPTWFVMPSGHWADASSYEGRVYRASGSPWLGAAYDPLRFRTTEVGTFRLRFAGEAATFDYAIDGRSGTMPLSRQPF